jgi:hypothetical protein
MSRRRRIAQQQASRSWAIYYTQQTPARLVGFIDAPDKRAAIAQAIKEYKIPVSERGGLVAQRRP